MNAAMLLRDFEWCVRFSLLPSFLPSLLVSFLSWAPSPLAAASTAAALHASVAEGTLLTPVDFLRFLSFGDLNELGSECVRRSDRRLNGKEKKGTVERREQDKPVRFVKLFQPGNSRYICLGIEGPG